MSAYVLIEATVRDESARDAYTEASPLTWAPFHGEVLTAGPWTMLFGETAFSNGMLLRFPDLSLAMNWYVSPAYQALIAMRTAAMDCRFRLLG